MFCFDDAYEDSEEQLLTLVIHHFLALLHFVQLLFIFLKILYVLHRGLQNGTLVLFKVTVRQRAKMIIINIIFNEFERMSGDSISKVNVAFYAKRLPKARFYIVYICSFGKEEKR